jgi:hypothetical protein
MNKYIKVLALLTTLCGCVTPSTMMVNREGKVVRCATTGYGYGVAGAIAMSTAQQSHDRGVKDAQILGFVSFPVATLGFDADTKSHPMRIIAVRENAAAAGLRPGDLLLEADPKPVESFFSVITIMNTKKPGDRVPVKIQRDDQVLLQTVVAAAR